MKAAKGSFPYAHRTLAEVMAMRGGGASVSRRHSSELFSDQPPIAPAAEAEAPGKISPPGASAPSIHRLGAATDGKPASAVGPCSAELRVARREAARRFLERQGFTIQRHSREALIPSWHVSGYLGLFTNEDLMALAVSRGFDPEAVAA